MMDDIDIEVSGPDHDSEYHRPKRLPMISVDGWRCPYCGTVYSPNTSSCSKCSKRESNTNHKRLDD